MGKFKNILYKVFLILIFLFGIYIRTNFYIENNVFEDDECRLALSLMNKNWWQVLLPLSPWATTPLFTLISKYIAEMTNYSEYALKFISYISSVAGMFVFYKLSSEYFKRKVLVLIALFLFAVNMFQLYYATIFKTYSLDVLIGLLLLYYLPKIDILKFDTKKLVCTTLVLSVIPLLSLCSVFFIAAYFCINIFYNFKNRAFWKKFLVIIIPFALFMALYYFLYLAPAKIVMLNSYKHYYDDFYKKSFYEVCAYNLRTFFMPAKFILFNFLLIIVSILLIIFNKNIRTKLDIYLLSSFGFLILFSMFHFYPIIGRTGLFILPVILLLLLKPADAYDIKKPFFCFIFILTFLSSFVFFNPAYLYSLRYISHFYITYSPKVLIQDIYNKYDEKNDIIIVNEASLFSFLFYREKYKMFNLKYDFVECTDNNTYLIVDYMNNLPKDKNYWFYFIKEFKKSPEAAIFMKWLQNKNIEYKKQDRDSYILYWKQL